MICLILLGMKSFIPQNKVRIKKKSCETLPLLVVIYTKSMQLPYRMVLYSQLILLLGLIVCILLAPSVLLSTPQGGLSNYGTMPATIAIFSMAFALSSGLLVLARKRIRQTGLKRGIFWLIVGYVILVISTYPYKLSVFFENAHIVIGFLLAIYQQVFALWLAKFKSFDNISKIALAVSVAGIFVGLLTALQVLQMLFTAQLIGGIGFSIMLVHAMRAQQPE